jgi:lysyl-tRNA synthetase class 2
LTLATQAIGEGMLGESRAAIAAFTVGLLVTFLAVRINTRLIRAKVKWWFHDIESEGGLHVHHMVIGVVLMVVAGIALIAALPHDLTLQLAALVFGAGVALTLDEFALILRLQDVYWTTEGRLSVDAVIVAVCAGMLLVLGIHPLGNISTAGLTGFQSGVAIVITIVVDLCFAVICLIKGKLWTGFFGLFIPFLGTVGAIRLARPGSPWAHKRYVDKPKKLAKAQRREERINATWRAWREAFFDLIAGKPHLPNVLPAARAGSAAEAAQSAASSAQGAAVTADDEPRPNRGDS